MLWKNEFGNIFGKVKVIDNFFKKDEIISREEAIKIMGKNLFDSHGARDIPENIYTKISTLNNN